jgi:hypothetical protein
MLVRMIIAVLLKLLSNPIAGALARLARSDGASDHSGVTVKCQQRRFFATDVDGAALRYGALLFDQFPDVFSDAVWRCGAGRPKGWPARIS